jgi:O-antigen/teichoic acid export membrane protein
VVNETVGGPEQPAVATVDELSGRTLLTGSVWVVASQALPQVYILVSSILIARFLTVDDMGHQSFIAFTSQTVVMVCGFGLSGSLVRYGGELLGQRRLGTLRGLVWWTATLQTCGALLAGVVMFAFGYFSNDLQAAWLWAAFGTAFATIQNVPAGVLSILRQWRVASIITLVIGFCFTVGIAIVLIVGGGVTGVFAIGTVLGFIALVWTAVIARRYLNSVAPTPAPHRELHRPLIGYAITIWGGLLLTFVVLRRSEFFFLERYSTAQAIAFYSVAFAVTAGLGSAVEALTAVVAPTVASLQGSGDSSRIAPGFSRALRIVILVTVPVAAFGFAFGPQLIQLVYGSDYAPTAAPLRIMLVAFPIVAIMTMCSGLLWGIGLVRVWLLSFCVAAIVNLLLDFTLIPAYAQTGAALANVGAQATASLLVVGYTVRTLGPLTWHARVLVRASVAALVAAMLGWVALLAIAGVAGAVTGLTVASVAFLGLSRLLRTVPAADAEWIADSVHGRVGRCVAHVIRYASTPDANVAAN